MPGNVFAPNQHKPVIKYQHIHNIVDLCIKLNPHLDYCYYHGLCQTLWNVPEQCWAKVSFYRAIAKPLLVVRVTLYEWMCWWSPWHHAKQCNLNASCLLYLFCLVFALQINGWDVQWSRTGASHSCRGDCLSVWGHLWQFLNMFKFLHSCICNSFRCSFLLCQLTQV